VLRSVSPTGYSLGRPVTLMKIIKTPVTDRTLFDIRLGVGALAIGIWRKRGLGRFRACASLLRIPQFPTSSRCAFPAYLRLYTVLGSSWCLFVFLLNSLATPCGSVPWNTQIVLNRYQPVGGRLIEQYTTTSLHFTPNRRNGRQNRRRDAIGSCVYNAPEERRRYEQALPARAHARCQRAYEEPLQKVLVVW
jgi:hypothetical protein